MSPLDALAARVDRTSTRTRSRSRASSALRTAAHARCEQLLANARQDIHKRRNFGDVVICSHVVARALVAGSCGCPAGHYYSSRIRHFFTAVITDRRDVDVVIATHANARVIKPSVNSSFLRQAVRVAAIVIPKVAVVITKVDHLAAPNGRTPHRQRNGQGQVRILTAGGTTGRPTRFVPRRIRRQIRRRS